MSVGDWKILKRLGNKHLVHKCPGYNCNFYCFEDRDGDWRCCCCDETSPQEIRDAALLCACSTPPWLGFCR